MKILLFGGDGFLGQGLQEELKLRDIQFKSIDKNDFDLTDYSNLNKCIDELNDISHIVILASKIGVDIFNNDAISASNYNKQIHQFIFDAIQHASKKYLRSYNVTYYSTSETYGNLNSKNEIITENSPYNFINGHSRYLYSYVKYQAELDYLKLNIDHPEIVSAIKIIHPFNVYGKNQKRGVVYKMIKTALSKNTIIYAEDTTRTLTGLKFASIKSVDVILSKYNIRHANIVDNRCSVTMKSLAYIIRDLLNLDNVEIIKCLPDKLIRYRHTSKPDADIDLTKSVMQDDIFELTEQIYSEIENEQLLEKLKFYEKW